MKIRMRGIRFTEVGKTTAFKDADMADVRMPADRPQRSVGIPLEKTVLLPFPMPILYFFKIFSIEPPSYKICRGVPAALPFYAAVLYIHKNR